mmetsp:Transcript_51517/g.130183  ORF Transcript_51517/g.130183 Transcript_51517/m.130183 type:complete len:244 (+) Transcript_51517:591-1322(+)
MAAQTNLRRWSLHRNTKAPATAKGLEASLKVLPEQSDTDVLDLFRQRPLDLLQLMVTPPFQFNLGAAILRRLWRYRRRRFDARLSLQPRWRHSHRKRRRRQRWRDRHLAINSRNTDQGRFQLGQALSELILGGIERSLPEGRRHRLLKLLTEIRIPSLEILFRLTCGRAGEARCSSRRWRCMAFGSDGHCGRLISYNCKHRYLGDEGQRPRFQESGHHQCYWPVWSAKRITVCHPYHSCCHPT